jgi:hypothetical protein
MRNPADRWEPQELSKNSPKTLQNSTRKMETCNQLATDCISRKAAIDALVKAIREDPYYDSNEAINGLGVCDVRVILNDLPSAQPEIIRCKDCKWWSNDDYRECSSPNYDDGYVTPAGFYCGYAERRTDERTD